MMSGKGLAVLCLAAAAVAAAPLASAEQVGQATRVRLYAYQTPPKAADREPVYRLSPIVREATLETIPDAAMEVTFADGSKLTMGPASQLVVDEFVYTGAASPSAQAVRYTKGIFRFVSGSVQKDKVKLQTPTMTIGVRGTVVKTKVNPDGSSTAFFEHGEGDVCGTAGACTPMKQGDMVKSDSKGKLSEVAAQEWSAGDESVDLGMNAFNRRIRGPDAGGGGEDGASDPGSSPDSD